MGYPDEHFIGHSKRVIRSWLNMHTLLSIRIYKRDAKFWCNPFSVFLPFLNYFIINQIDAWNVLFTVIFVYLFRLAYLHEGLEPKVVHRDVKSSNILIDRQWNSKVSDFGLAKLLHSDHSYVTTRVMGTFGLVWFDKAFSYLCYQLQLLSVHVRTQCVASWGLLTLSLSLSLSAVMLHPSMPALECWPRGVTCIALGYLSWN